ncbi:hypothetical protein RFI_13206, partial [Reticulomyxa filosa]
ADALQPQAEALEPLINRRKKKFASGNAPFCSDSAFKNAVAPSITNAAKELSRRRTSFKLNQALSTRRGFQGLVNDHIVMSEHIAPTLHPLAFELEKKIKERVTQNYLQKKGVLPAKLTLDNALQNVAGNLQKQLERRPSLLDNDEFIQSVLLPQLNIDGMRLSQIDQPNTAIKPDQDQKVK